MSSPRTTWPDTVAMASKWLDHLPEDTQHKIAVGNATRVYNFTPADLAGISTPDPLLRPTYSAPPTHDWGSSKWSSIPLGPCSRPDVRAQSRGEVRQ